MTVYMLRMSMAAVCFFSLIHFYQGLPGISVFFQNSESFPVILAQDLLDLFKIILCVKPVLYLQELLFPMFPDIQ